MSDDFDDHLRSRLFDAVGPSADADSVLDDLRPALTRARRAAWLRTGAAGLVLVLGTSGAAAAVLTTVDDGPESVVVATAPAMTTGSITSPMSEPTTTTAETSVMSSPPPSTATSSASTVGTTSSRPTETTHDADPTTTSNTADPTTTTSSASSAPSEPTTTERPSTSSIESVCGSIVVSVVGEVIELVRSLADDGYEIDEKSSGPESVEVSFESSTNHCEIKAEVRDGELWTDVDEE